MFKKIALVIGCGIFLGGCQVTTGHGPHGGPVYNPYYIRPAPNPSYAHTNPYRYRPYVSSPVCHPQRVYHPVYGTQIVRRCFN